MDTGFRQYDEFIYLRYYIEIFYKNCCCREQSLEIIRSG